MKILFQHLRDTKNVGDRSCSPYDYFSWPEAEVQDIRRSPTSPYCLGIFGGGKIFGGFPNYAGVTRLPGQVNVAWGVSTVQSFPISLKYSRARRLMDLVGTRDWGDDRYIYAPCVSCMSPLFDHAGEELHDVVFYAHAGKTSSMNIKVPVEVPMLTNNCADMQTALAFLSSGKTVVTNSYHGVYWALLLKRKVLCLPFSRKFNGFQISPGYSSAYSWQKDINKARAAHELLDLSRAATLSFRERILRITNDL